MTNTNKTTEAMRYTALLNCSEACALFPDMADWFTKKLEQIENRKANKKPTDAQVAATEMTNAIYDAMSPDVRYSIADMIKTFPCCEGASNQMVYSRLRSLMSEGKVERIEEKRKVFFVRH